MRVCMTAWLMVIPLATYSDPTAAHGLIPDRQTSPQPSLPFIVTVGKSASSNEQFAASQLRDLLSQLRDSQGQHGSDEPTMHVRVGWEDTVRAGVPPSLLEGLGDEGYRIVTSHNLTTLPPHTIAVSGGQNAARGTMYAVFDLLRSFGFRFLAPDETVVPTLHTAVAAASGASRALDTRVVPALLWRSHESYETDGADPTADPPSGTAQRQALNYLWTARVRNNGLGEHIEGGGFPNWVGPTAHTSYSLLSGSHDTRAPPPDLWKTHREWFWPRDDPTTYGQLCWSNTSLVATVTANILTMLRANPNGTMLSVSINDNDHACNDTTEQAVVAVEQSQSGPIVRAVNTIAAAVATEFPRVYIHTLAYSYTRVAPRVTRPASNVVVQVASSGVGDPDILSWGAISTGGGIFVWDYVVNYKNAVQPFPNYFDIGPRYQWYADKGVTGIYSEGFGHGPGCDMDALKAFVIESMMWDPKQNPTALVTEFLNGYYGNAAPFVLEYLHTMQSSLNNVTATYNLTTRDEPTAPYLTVNALLSSAAVLAQGVTAASSVVRYAERVKTIQLAVYYPILLRWTELRDAAASRGFTWTVEPTMEAALQHFLTIAERQNVTRLMEPDDNDFDSPHNLTWFADQVRCNCSWALTCCRYQECCHHR
eukprot:m.149867 g.149867  ORF g.149867 m.149867 type:complete len:651 (-) comp11676_c0_seq7:399-2351(-)